MEIMGVQEEKNIVCKNICMKGFVSVTVFMKWLNILNKY